MKQTENIDDAMFIKNLTESDYENLTTANSIHSQHRFNVKEKKTEKHDYEKKMLLENV